ncbi:hypothetical protein DVH24_011005 [Malus domestica]|uniref:Non-specific serine/threonine protein kinase n=1 Tax=Malus domestica TaxID=3750 RepID=A0A498JTB7_MALDO|nr:hypothetical protein DVH24_011005 [Malus domestica]
MALTLGAQEAVGQLHLRSCLNESLPLISLQHINLTSLLLFNLTSLITLNLSFNDLSDTFPSEFANFKSMKYLDLSETGLKGQIPKVLGNLCKLKFLSLTQNNFDGEWKSFGSVSQIVQIIHWSH